VWVLWCVGAVVVVVACVTSKKAGLSWRRDKTAKAQNEPSKAAMVRWTNSKMINTYTILNIRTPHSTCKRMEGPSCSQWNFMPTDSILLVLTFMCSSGRSVIIRKSIDN